MVGIFYNLHLFFLSHLKDKQTHNAFLQESQVLRQIVT